MTSKKYPRVYVCHTYYHAYVSFLKELALPKSEQGKAHLILSKMSNNFESLKERVEKTGVFEKVFEYDEKNEKEFPQLSKWRKDTGSQLKNLFNRIIFTKKFSKSLEADVPVNFKEYGDIYVYCDNDPIGWYLSGHRIYYHAVEDGLDTISLCVAALRDNRGATKLKVFMSNVLNLIFIRDGYNKYCLDMEVNDVSKIDIPWKKYKEVPRKPLQERLTDADKEVLLTAFVDNLDELKQKIAAIDKDRDNILILTEPLCDLDTRKQIFVDLVEEYSKKGNVFFKQHPRDYLDYDKEFPQIVKFSGSIPMEILNFFLDLHFKTVVSVFTNLNAVTFADEKVILGTEFMKKYESSSVHDWINSKKLENYKA